jgi:MerR family transcriptional regulator, light-induced transcriptional regulator
MAAGLNIAALAQRTGVAPDTLRKWEQRYRILRPSRTAGGQRRYSERDVARVEWLLQRLGEGYRISEAATLLGDVNVAPTRTPEDHLATIVDALDDPTAVGILVDQAFALHGVDMTLDRILRPLLHEIGDRWERGEISAAEERVVSEAVRSRLGHLLADAGGGVRGVAVLACAPGEQHELGLMMLAIALRRDGWKIVYLGANTPIDQAVDLAKKHDARVLAISATVVQPPDVPELEGVAVLVGGCAARAHTGSLDEAVAAVQRFAA